MDLSGKEIVVSPDAPGLSDPLLEEVRRFYEANHEGIEASRRRHRYYYEYLRRIFEARIPAGQRVLDLGCGSGDLLAALKPSLGVGIDVAPSAIAAARRTHQARGLSFLPGDVADRRLLAELDGPFDVILLVNVVTHLTDVQETLENLHPLCHSRTRIFIYSYSRLWQPLLRLGEGLGLKYRQPPESWLPPEEIENMLSLADFEVVRRDRQIVFPLHVPGLSDLLNRFAGHLPLVDQLSLMFGIVSRPAPPSRQRGSVPEPSTSVIIPCRNEAGHIRPLVLSLPPLGPNSEFLFVEGNSTDDTEAVIRQVVAERPDLPLRLLKQTGRGKGDAVRLGFAEARGEIVLILDSDMGVAPADVPKFVEALVRGKGDMVNGSRMVYPMEGRAMRFLNLLANKLFAILFSWLLGQQVRDTLCGTKALYREDYERIAANRSYFGDFDPFGDFDLLFGAARLNLRIVDIAVRYHERVYGETNISRWRHGWLLLRMSLFAARKLKFH
jgi:SAM-dependent methyltransferase